MDIAIIIGVGICFACMMVGIVMAGGSIKSYTSLDSLIIVAGGIIGSILAGTSIKEGLSIFQILKDTIKPKKIKWMDTVSLFTKLSAEARREGVLSLQNKIEGQQNELIRLGLQLIVDGADSDVLFLVVGTKIQLQKNKDNLGEKLFSRMGEAGPTFGMLGTVIGLIQVLANLSEPEKLGAGIAQAFLTTFYGIVFSSMIFKPLATKVNRNNAEKSGYYEMILTGLQSIHEGDNPFMVEEKLKAFCPDIKTAKDTREPEKEGAGQNEYTKIQAKTT